MNQYKQGSKQRGITLIEVLVTLVILSIGLLGSLRMQLLSIRSNTDAGLLSQATIMTNDFAERIRINRTAARAGTYKDDVDKIDYSAIACDTLPAKPCWDRSGATATQCNSDEMAISDAWRWVCSIEDQIPAATAAVTWDGTAYTISLQWNNIDLNGVSQSNTVAINLVP